MTVNHRQKLKIETKETCNPIFIAEYYTMHGPYWDQYSSVEHDNIHIILHGSSFPHFLHKRK